MGLDQSSSFLSWYQHSDWKNWQVKQSSIPEDYSLEFWIDTNSRIGWNILDICLGYIRSPQLTI